MGRTSIPCDDETREVLVKHKQDSDNWDDCLLRLANQTPPAPSDTELDEVIARLEDIQNSIDTIDTGDGENGPSVNEIREAVRTEVRNQLQDLRH